MEKSKVYFTNLRTSFDSNLLQKLRKLILAAGMDSIDFKNKYAAIKLHFGEPGNLAFLRPNYAKVVADVVKELGGKPFLTDCNTLYVGGRKNALDHLDSAMQNGFHPLTTGCQILIGDGLKGTDETLVPIDGDYVKEAKIGTAIMDADVFISLTHFKGHEATGFGGTLKNIGMGCGSRAGKMEMHSAGKPHVNQDRCVGCGSCQKNCRPAAEVHTAGRGAAAPFWQFWGGYSHRTGQPVPPGTEAPREAGGLSPGAPHRVLAPGVFAPTRWGKERSITYEHE